MGSVTLSVRGINLWGPDFDTFLPPDPGKFGIHCQVLIAEIGAGDDPGDAFELVVCSPSWFVEQDLWGDNGGVGSSGLTVMSRDVCLGSGIWFMRTWDSSLIRSSLDAICEEASPGPDWETVAARIGRRVPWEFDWKYDADLNEKHGLPRPGHAL